MLGGCPAADRKDDRRGIGQGLLHVVHDVRDGSEEILRLDQAAGVAAAQKVCGLLCEIGLVKACVLVAAGIGHLRIGHRQDIGGVYTA